ncbi:MAG: phosphodiester glycosidase family protein [Oscillospiraceae bacterium]|nr:phosphodiester glycosidase family protein [Oscillospiraceae bacterium]
MRAIGRFFRKPYAFAAVYALCLLLACAAILLDAFVIPRAQQPAQVEQTAPQALMPGETMVTDTSYQDQNIRITIETLRTEGTNVYVADIQLTDASLLRAAFAQDTFGRNIKGTTSETAAAHDAILAINGDNYGARDAGFVLRNGVLYRGTARPASEDDALLVDAAGDFHILDEMKTDEATLEGAWQVFAFGPALVRDGVVAVAEGEEIAYARHASVDNPRTAIGQVEALHYVMVVTDGRTRNSEGLTLLELAELMQSLGCLTAYNLDGGGSSTLVFQGEVINQPTAGRSIKEREINDIVYIGY